MRVLGCTLVVVLVGACAFDQGGVGASLDGSLGAADAPASDSAVMVVDGSPGQNDATMSNIDAGQSLADAPLPSIDAPVPIDAAPPADAEDCAWPWTPTNFDPCDGALPTATMDANWDSNGTYTLDTDNGNLSPPFGFSTSLPNAVLSQSGGPDVMVVVLKSLNIGGNSTIRVEGGRPLILAVYGTATISGHIDASGRDPFIGSPVGGPGADTDCSNLPTAGGNATNGTSGGGGGGGGAYGGDGGDGADGHGDGKGSKGVKGDKHGSATLSPLRGGCSGARGGDGVSDGGDGGVAGGAVQIAARDSLTVSGAVRASGLGGEGGGKNIAADGRAGGGGGGSGGAILLESASTTVSMGAVLCATGGSGGEGSDNNEGGADGNIGPCDGGAASTPNDANNGGNGGNGGTTGNGSGASNGTSGGGGGGGGGGAGRIHVRGTTTLDLQGTTIPSP